MYEPPGGAGATGGGGSGRGLVGTVAAAGVGAAKAVIEGAAGMVGGALGIAALMPASKRARRLDHGGVGLVGSVLKSLTGSLFAAPTYPLLDTVVDHHRRLAYTLASNGEIRVYGLGGSPVAVAAGLAITGVAAGTYAQAAGGSRVLPPSTALPLLAGMADPEAACRAYASDPHTSSLNKPRPDVFKPDLAERVLGGGGLLRPGGGADAAAAAGQSGLAWPLVSLHVIPPHQSSRVHLVALAKSGARLYFSTHSMARYLALGAGGAGAAAGGGGALQQLLHPHGGGHDGSSSSAEAAAAHSVSLTLVYVRMPPPAVTADVYTSHAGSGATGGVGSGVDYASYTPDGFAPSEDAPTLGDAHDAFVCGDLALIPTTNSAGGGDGAAADAAGVGSEHVVALVRDPLLHASGSSGGGGGAGYNGARFNESVQDILLDGTVYGVAEVRHPGAPSALGGSDPVFTETGVLALPEGETAPLPALGLRDICAGAGVAVPEPSLLSGAGVLGGGGQQTGQLPQQAASLAGSKRGFDAITGGAGATLRGLLGFGGSTRGGGAAAGAALGAAGAASAQAALMARHLTALPHALALQSALLESGVPARFHHLVRRRLWGEQPGAGELQTPFSAQHDGAGSMRGYVVLTTFGVYRLASVRPLDQVSRLLATRGGTAAAGGGGVSGGGPKAASTMVAATPGGRTAAAATLGRSGVFGGAATGALSPGGGDAASTSMVAWAAAPSSASAAFPLSRWFVGDEVCAMAVTLAALGGACGDVWSQAGLLMGRSGPFSPSGAARTPRGKGAGATGPLGSPGSPPASLLAGMTLAGGGGNVGGSGASAGFSVPPAVSRAAGALFDTRGGLPGWRGTTHEYRLEDLVFSGRLNGLLLTASRLLRPLWGASVFITPPVVAAAAAGGSRGGAHAAGRVSALLPRFSAPELRPLHASLTSLVGFMGRHFSFCSWGDAQLAALARDTGLLGRLGLKDHPAVAAAAAGATGRLGASTAAATATATDADAFMIPLTDDDRRKRANALEMTYVILLYRLLARAAEGVALLAAVAEPAHGGLPVLAGLAAGPQPQQGQQAPLSQSAVPDDALFALAGGPGRLTFAQLVTAPEGLTLAEGLTTRMLQALRALAPAIASTSGGGSGGASSGGAGLLGSLPGYVSPQRPSGGSSTAGGGAAALVHDAASSLAGYLRSQCPSFFPEGQQALLVAERSLDGARAALTAADRLRLLESSLREAGRAVTNGDADSIGGALPRLSALCAGYAGLGFYTGVIGLCLAGGDRLARLAGAHLAAIPADALPLVAPGGSQAADDGSAAPAAGGTAALRLRLYGIVLDTLAAVRAGDATAAVVAGAGGVGVPGAAAPPPLEADPANTLTVAPAGGAAAAAAALLLQQTAAARTAGAMASTLSATSLLGGGSGAEALPPAESAFRSLLAEVLRSGDALFHHSLYARLAVMPAAPSASGATTAFAAASFVNGGTLVPAASSAPLALLLPRLSTPFIEQFLTGSFPVVPAYTPPATPGGAAAAAPQLPPPTPSLGGPRDPDLLFSWLMAHGRYREAAGLQKALADREGDGYAEPLGTRIERLTLAVAIAKEPRVRLAAASAASAGGSGALAATLGAFSTASGAPPGGPVTGAAPLVPASEVADWEAALEVLRLQAEVRGALARAAAVLSETSGPELVPPELSQALAELNTGKPDLTSLYKRYAARFGLHEACLAILAAGRQPEWAPLVARHWQALVAERLTAVGQADGGGPAAAIASLSSTIADLGRRFVTEGGGAGGAGADSPLAGTGAAAASAAANAYHAFPLGFLVELLETHACGDGWREALDADGGDGYPAGKWRVGRGGAREGLGELAFCFATHS